MKNYINMIREINLNNITEDKLESTLLKLVLNDEDIEITDQYEEFNKKYLGLGILFIEKNPD